jgi:predicted transcriptional regulator of viral defense system
MNSIKRRVQGRLLDLVRRLSAAGKQVFTADDARKYLAEDATLWLALTRLQKAGWIKRLKRGVYLIVPLEAGVERRWSEDAFVVACSLAEPAAVAYWSAMRHWNWTTQVPQTVFVQTTQRKSAYRRIVLGVTYRFIPVIPKKFFGIRRERIGAKMFSVTDREKTLLDILDRPDLSGGMPEILSALPTAMTQVEWERLDAYLKKFPNRAALKRLGVLVEAMDLAIPNREVRLRRWQRMVSGGIALLDPGGGPTAGRVQTAWGVRVNIPVHPAPPA